MKFMLIFLFIFIIPEFCLGQGKLNFYNNNLEDPYHLISNNIRYEVNRDTLIKYGKIYQRENLKFKNPGIAILLALVPGAIIRGSGHFYAGHNKTGIALLSLFFLSFIGASQNIGPVNADAIGTVSILTILGTWAYDIIASPIVCARDNKKKREMLSIHPYVNHCLFGNQMGLKLVYHF